jgi:hypothetical protein
MGNTIDQESLKNYAQPIANIIKHPNPVLIGVSFVILVQEMPRFIDAKKVNFCYFKCEKVTEFKI